MTHPTLDPDYVLPVIQRKRRLNVQQTSVDAHKKTKIKRTKDAERVVHVIKVAQLAGMDGLTGREVCEHYEQTFGDPFPPNEASAMLIRLLRRGLVERDKKRTCSVSGLEAWLYHCPMKQAGLL